MGGMRRIERHKEFLRSILREGNRLKRKELIEHANSDRINAINVKTFEMKSALIISFNG